MPAISPGKTDRGESDKKLALFEEHAPASPSVLHVGCVGGQQTDARWMHRRLDELSSSLVGIDIHEAGIERMREAEWDAQVADAHEFDLDRKFDVVAAPNVIEHLHSPGQFLRSAAAHLAEDGVVLLNTPRTWSLHHVLTWVKDGEVVVSPEHTMWFDDLTFRRLVGLSSLRVTDHATFRWQRTAASSVDRAYLMIEQALASIGTPNKYHDCQHFYCLEQ